ncbi:hypothetical protein JCM19037_3898 [Geomicrobium sp. JCM 19037]|nr:hypothetical protein JCM19037_3898 [Geomicrobium sp. JCM 19037]
MDAMASLLVNTTNPPATKTYGIIICTYIQGTRTISSTQRKAVRHCRGGGGS